MPRPTSRSACRKGATEQSPEARANLYDEVTACIIAELEVGRFPWVQPRGKTGQTRSGVPRNARTAQTYSGISKAADWLLARLGEARGARAAI